MLHGHNHEQTLFELETVTGPAIVVGVPSASEAVSGRIPMARYNEYCIAKVDNGWRCEMVGRAVATAHAHVSEIERRIIEFEVKAWRAMPRRTALPRPSAGRS